MSELPKTYDPKSVEDKLYKFWVDSGFFHAEVNPDKKPYTIVIPPPNVTGQLHMGHAFDETLQDILIRTKRMQGYDALWLPGTDHAGIATEVKVVEQDPQGGGPDQGTTSAERNSSSAHGTGRTSTAARIIEQLKKLGASCDWEQRALHHGRGLLQGGQRGVREPVQQGPDLSRATASSTGVRTARPPSPMPRSNMRSRHGHLLAYPLPAG